MQVLQISHHKRHLKQADLVHVFTSLDPYPEPTQKQGHPPDLIPLKASAFSLEQRICSSDQVLMIPGSSLKSRVTIYSVSSNHIKSSCQICRQLMLDSSTDRQGQVHKAGGSIMREGGLTFNYDILSHQFNLSKESEKGLASLVLMVEDSGQLASLLRVGLLDSANKNTCDS